MGESSWYFMLPLGLLAIYFSTLPLQAGSVTLNGTDWTLSVGLIGSENGTDTYRVTLRGDTANYTDSGTFISSVAIKISGSIIGDMELTRAPEGTTLDNWTYVPGGMNGKGCSEKGRAGAASTLPNMNWCSALTLEASWNGNSTWTSRKTPFLASFSSRLII